MPGSAFGLDYLIPNYLPTARGLADRENMNRERADRFLLDEFNRNTGDVASERDMNRMYAGMSDTAARQGMAAQRNARQAFGASGVAGGGMLGTYGGMLELQRLGQLTESRRGARQWMMEQNAAQRMRRQQAAGQVADRLGQGPSMLELDAMGDLIGAQTTREGLALQAQAGRDANRTNRQSGILGLIGNVAGGLLGAI